MRPAGPIVKSFNIQKGKVLEEELGTAKKGST